MSRPNTPEDVWKRIAKGKPNDCWLWQGSTRSTGYGSFSYYGRIYSAHRFVYELVVGKIPAGKVTDHICRTRLCCNPAHIRIVTNRENVLAGIGHTAVNARKTHCLNGHEFTSENTHITKKGQRECRTCVRLGKRERRARSRGTERSPIEEG
jgi:hypothetical protein